MDLKQLADNLRNQAQSTSTLLLDNAVFTDAALTAVRSAFALSSDENLTISEVEASNVPEPANGVLKISGGKVSVFKQNKVPVSLTFTSPASGLQATIVVELADKWNFKDSFEDLDTFPFNLLTTTGARFVYSTVAQKNYTWPGDADTRIDLEPGLNFLAHVTIQHLETLQNTLQKLLKSIGNWSLALKFHGPFTPQAGQVLPVGKLRAPLGDGELEVGAGSIKLNVSNPALALQIGEATEDDPLQQLDLLVEAVFQQRLKVAIAVSPTGDVLEVNTEPLPHYAAISDLIVMLPGGQDFKGYIPAELNTIFDNVGLNNFSLNISSEPRVTYLGLSIGTLKPWTVLPGILELTDLSMEIQTIDPAEESSWTRVQIESHAKFLPKIFDNADFDFIVELEKETSWQVQRVSGAYYGSVTLEKIVKGILGNNVAVPPSLGNIAFSDFGVNAHREGGDFGYTFFGSVEIGFPILDTHLTSALDLVVTKNRKGDKVVLGGGLMIGEQVFTLALKFGTGDSKLTAEWKNQGTALGFGDIASAFGWHSMPEIPEGLDLALKEATFTYDFDKKIVALRAESANYGQIVFASLVAPSTRQRVYLFSLDVPLNIKFSELPLVGESLRMDPPVGVNELQINVASAKLTDNDVTALNSHLKRPLIPKELGKGVTIAANIAMNGPHEIVLPLTSPEKEQPKLLSTGATNHRAEPKWFNLKKTLGPVHFDKVGVQYQDAKLSFLLNAAFTAAGLTLSVDGLSVSSSLKKFEPDFNLRGLGIEYKAGDVEIGGAFLKTGPKGSESYDGAAVIKTKQFALSALGSYAKIQGEPSLFIYAFLDYPLGGPAFFFVTGLAAGFGYNRRLIAPSIDNVAEFPLIKQAVRGRDVAPKGVMEALNTLRTHVPPASGSIFLAVGVKFNSFKLIDSFALLTMEFGDKLAINLLGLSTAIVPTPEAGKTVTPLAQVQIAWKATFDPDDGCLGIDARLTPNSYILSKDCRLSGGYAFYSWFSGPNAGDFVQTLGGYHPEFKVPAHYPRVPRLAFDWRVSSSLTIQGDAYYALTGSALMAGGHLEVLYRQGELRAWLKVGADFLIAWKPYHYDARLYVNVGASYTFDINLLFARIRVTISVDVGAQLHLWGPDFSGTARIDLSVISFTISFGAGASQTPEPIKEWSTFQQSFLPAKNICSIAVKDGLVRNIGSGETERWVINPKELALVVDSAVPFKSARLKSKPNEEMVQGTVKFGVGPMDLASPKLNSNVTVTVMRGDERVDGKFKYSVIKKKVPAGLWGESASPKVNGNNFIEGVPAGIEILPNTPPDAGKTANVDVKVLDHGDTDFPWPCAWGPVSLAPPGDKGDAREKRKRISDTIGSNSMRAQIMKELNIKIDVNVKQTIAVDFVSAPQIGPFYVK
jgi:hypothetical protein